MWRAIAVSCAVAAAACGLPFLTHFADHGLSVLLHLVWIVIAVDVLRRHGRRGAWVLLGAPLALYWPGALILWLMDGAPIRLF